MHAAEHWSFLSFLKPFLFYVNEVWVGCAVVEWSPHVCGVTILFGHGQTYFVGMKQLLTQSPLVIWIQFITLSVEWLAQEIDKTKEIVGNFLFIIN